MICENCGFKQSKADATLHFEKHFNWDLSYFMDIDPQKLCGDCAVDFIEKKIG